MAAAYLRAPGFRIPRPQPFCRKAGYTTRKQASQALKQLSLAGANGMRVYKCPVCPLTWHHGHPGETHAHRALRAKRMARQTEF